MNRKELSKWRKSLNKNIEQVELVMRIIETTGTKNGTERPTRDTNQEAVKMLDEISDRIRNITEMIVAEIDDLKTRV